jgi:predicted MFS family arabinose efflux permease
VTRLVRDRVSWLLYAMLGVFGYFLYGFGPVVPLLRQQLEISRTVAGLYGPALAVGTTIGGALFPYLVRRWRVGGTLWLGLAGNSLGVALLCLLPSVAGTLAASVVAMAFGVILISGISTALTAHHGPAASAAISEANALAAGMGLLAPLVIGAAVNAEIGWQPGLAVAIALACLLAVIATLFRVRITAGDPTPGPQRTGRLPRRYWLAWTCLFATGSAEVCLSLWASEQLHDHAGLPRAAAAAGMSAVLVGMVAGRAAGGRLSLWLGTVPSLLGALGLAGVGFAVFWAATVPWLAVTGLVLCGLGISLHFPLGLTLSIEASGGQPELALARNAYGMALGFGVAPFLLGALADRTGITSAFLLVPACLAIAAAAVWLLRRVSPRQPAASSIEQADLDPAPLR